MSKLARIVFIIFAIISIASCSFIKKDGQNTYGSVRGKIVGCRGDYQYLFGEIILYRLEDDKSDSNLNPSAFTDSTRITVIRTDSLGLFTKDHVLTGSYFALLNGSPRNILPSDTNLPISEPIYQTYCGKIKVDGILIKPDTISIIDVDLPISKGDWNKYDYYFQESKSWIESYEVE